MKGRKVVLHVEGLSVQTLMVKNHWASFWGEKLKKKLTIDKYRNVSEKKNGFNPKKNEKKVIIQDVWFDSYLYSYYRIVNLCNQKKNLYYFYFISMNSNLLEIIEANALN